MTEQKSENAVSLSSRGRVIYAFGNLLHVRFNDPIQQGEVGFVHLAREEKTDHQNSYLRLKSEVIEIQGDEAKLQVFEDISGVSCGTEVVFEGALLEAELGPGLLTSIFDGLQNPLEVIGESSGYFLPRGLYPKPLDRERKWSYTPVACVGEELLRGDTLGSVPEGRFTHQVMVPFSHFRTYTLIWVIKAGEYSIDTVVAKAVDSEGVEVSFTLVQTWPIKKPLLEGTRIKAVNMLKTGMRMIDTQFPIVQGGTFCTPGPFGAGKTVLQHHLAKYSSVDIVVVTACGERAGEVVEILKEFPHLKEPHSGESLINRTVIICNTSSMPVAARESSVYMGVTIAEYYRQMGLNVLLLADSTSRWAQAMREMSGRLEEIPGEEAFPAYLSSRIAEFYERSGLISLRNGKEGSVTIGGAVSPAGGNFEEPVTQSTLSVVGAFLGLSRVRAYARRYPAIDPLISWSKYLEEMKWERIDLEKIGKELSTQVENWSEKVRQTALLMKEGHDIQKRIEVLGEEGVSIDDMMIYLKTELYDICYLQQNSFDPVDTYCPIERQIVLFSFLQRVFATKFSFSSHDEVRHFFLVLQTDIKNMNTLPVESEEYQQSWKNLEKKLEEIAQKGESIV